MLNYEDYIFLKNSAEEIIKQRRIDNSSKVLVSS